MSTLFMAIIIVTVDGKTQVEVVLQEKCSFFIIIYISKFWNGESDNL